MNNRGFAKKRNAGTLSNLAYNVVQPVPSHATNNGPQYSTAATSLPTVPSSGPGAVYVPNSNQYYNNDKAPQHYAFQVVGNPPPAPQYNQTPVNQNVPNYDPFYQQAGFQQQNNQTVSLFQPTPYQSPMPTLPNYPAPPEHTQWHVPIEKKPHFNDDVNMEEFGSPSGDFEEYENIDSPKIGSSYSSEKGKAPSGSDKRPRDPHRKEIENRAATKRKDAVKRLSQVIAERTRSLPENGLANQLVIAIELLTEDGQTISQLQKRNRELEKEKDTLQKANSQLKTEALTLRNKIQNLERR